MSLKYSKIEVKNYYEGIDVEREDWSWCRGNKKRIDECIKSCYAMKDLCKKMKDKNGVLFQNSYLSYFFGKLNQRKKHR